MKNRFKILGSFAALMFAAIFSSCMALFDQDEVPSSYKVECYLQNIADDAYTINTALTQEHSGIAGKVSDFVPKTLQGFTAKDVEQKTIRTDRTTVLKVYYDRNLITLSFNTDGGNAVTPITGKFGAAVTKPANPVKTGYVFNRFEPEFPKTMPNTNTTYTAKWTAGEGTAYKIEHYKQNIEDDNYTLESSDTETKTGTTGSSTAAAAKTYTGFTAKPVTQQTIAPDGSTIVKIYYDRKTATLSFNTDGGNAITPITGKFGAAVTKPANPAKTGYTFASWTPLIPTVMPAEDAVFTAVWANATNTAYKIEHYKQNIENDNYTLESSDTETKTGTTGSTTAAAAKTYTGFTAKPVTQQTIAPDGSTIVKIYYDRKTATLSFNTNGGNAITPITGKFGAAVTKPANPAKTGYTFASWTPLIPTVMPAEDAAYTANWTANTYKIVFNANGGDGTMAAQSFTYDTAQNLKANTFTKTGYNFNGWTTENGSTNYSAEQSLINLTAENNAVITLYAKWKIAKYQVNFSAEGGNGSLSASIDGNPFTGGEVEYGKTVVFTATPNAKFHVDTWTILGGTFQTGGADEEEASVKITAATTVKVSFILYKKVPFEKLNAYLSTASASEVNYIEVTGLKASDLKGVISFDGNSTPSALGKIFRDNASKKISLKLPKEITGLTDMSSCFFACNNLVQISEIPSSVTIMAACFYGCTRLTQAPVIPNSVTNMASCFYGCTRLTQAPVIPNSVTNMTTCFTGCTSLTQAPVIPNSVTDMNYCFTGCTSLTQAPVIPNSVTYMYGCFRNCTSLTQAPVIPSSVTSMTSCFYGCTSLTQAPVIPNSVRDMHECFRDCTSLTQAPVIPNSVTNMFCCFADCTSLTQAPVISSSVTDMVGCFRNCTSLTQAPVVPNSVTHMGYCFYGCTSLTQAPVIPSSVISMTSCFYGCTSLIQAPVIPNSVTDMASCFRSCTSLTTVTLKCSYNDRYHRFEDVFKDCTNLSAGSIKVPAGQLSVYQSHASYMGAQSNWFVAE